MHSYPCASTTMMIPTTTMPTLKAWTQKPHSRVIPSPNVVRDEPARQPASLPRPLLRDLLVGDLALEHDDPIEQRLGPRRAPGDEHVDRDDLVHPLGHRV
jgi:hypothetical protein